MLNECEPPEFVFEPVEILLCPELGPAVGAPVRSATAVLAINISRRLLLSEFELFSLIDLGIAFSGCGLDPNPAWLIEPLIDDVAIAIAPPLQPCRDIG